jgi:hypothetical protein
MEDAVKRKNQFKPNRDFARGPCLNHAQPQANSMPRHNAQMAIGEEQDCFARALLFLRKRPNACPGFPTSPCFGSPCGTNVCGWHRRAAPLVPDLFFWVSTPGFHFRFPGVAFWGRFPAQVLTFDVTLCAGLRRPLAMVMGVTPPGTSSAGRPQERSESGFGAGPVARPFRGAFAQGCTLVAMAGPT